MEAGTTPAGNSLLVARAWKLLSVEPSAQFLNHSIRLEKFLKFRHGKSSCQENVVVDSNVP